MVRNGAHRRTPEDLGRTATADNVGTDGEAPTGTETHGPDTVAIPDIATTAPAAVRASTLETDPQSEDDEKIKAKNRAGLTWLRGLICSIWDAEKLGVGSVR